MANSVAAKPRTLNTSATISMDSALLSTDSFCRFPDSGYVIGGSQVSAPLRSEQSGCPLDILLPSAEGQPPTVFLVAPDDSITW